MAPLRENPEVAANVKKEMELMARFGEPRPGTPTSIEEAAALERQLTRNPEDSVTREMLLSFYQWTGKNTQPWNDNVAARRRHALWLVEHHPEHSLVMRAPVTKETDPEGYAQLRKRWLAVTAPSKVHPRVLINAAWFFALPEGHPSRPAGQQEISVAEGLLLRALAQPEERRAVDFYSAGGGGGYRSMALSRLVSLYVSALAPRPGQAEDPTLAAWAKQRLDGSGDAEVLLTAGEQLYFRRETRELARSYLERVSRMQVDYYPQRARELIAQNDARYDAAFPFGTAPNSEWRAIVEKSTGALKLRQLAAIAAREYQMAEYYDWRTKQPAGGANASPDAEQDKRMAADGFANAKKYAREAIDLASSLKGTGVGEAAFNAHIAYGLAVLREGDRKGAVEHLQAAAMLPAPNGGIGRWASGQEYRLVFYLLKNGERQTIVDYFERAAQGRDEARKKVMLESASAIREGRMPEHYQRLVATGNL